MRHNILSEDDLPILAAPIGTKEWALNKKLRIQKKIDAAEDDIVDLDTESVDFITSEAWRMLEREDGTPFITLHEFAMAERPYGLGCTEWQYQIILVTCNKLQDHVVNAAARAKVLNGHGGDRQVDNYQLEKVEGGTSADYLTARIARDHPDIYDGMLRGEYRSVRAAAIDAGIVKAQRRYNLSDDPQAAGKYLAERVDRQWFETLIDAYYKAIES